MNREQAINYLYSSGYDKEQVKAIEDAFIVVLQKGERRKGEGNL